MLKYVLLSQLNFRVSYKEAILWVDLPEKCLHCGTIKTLLWLVDYPDQANMATVDQPMMWVWGKTEQWEECLGNLFENKVILVAHNSHTSPLNLQQEFSFTIKKETLTHKIP